MSLATRRKLLPWLFLGPGLLWLLIFFLYPLLAILPAPAVLDNERPHLRLA